MAHAQSEPAAKRRAFDLTAVLLFVGWNLGTVAGALAGQGLGNPQDLGLDAMFPAVFLALLAPQLRNADSRRAALAGGLGGARAGHVRAGRRADHRGRRRRGSVPGARGAPPRPAGEADA